MYRADHTKRKKDEFFLWVICVETSLTVPIPRQFQWDNRGFRDVSMYLRSVLKGFQGLGYREFKGVPGNFIGFFFQ